MTYTLYSRLRLRQPYPAEYDKGYPPDLHYKSPSTNLHLILAEYSYDLHPIFQASPQTAEPSRVRLRLPT